MLQQFNPKNKDLKVYVNGQILHRDEAKISVFDSVVQGGDAVWEGLRKYPEGIVSLQEHLDRLSASAKALAFENIPPHSHIRDAIRTTLEANGMDTDTHIRLTLTRGEKITSGMDPRLNTKGCGLIVLAEWKPLVYDNKQGIAVISSAIRRNGPQYLDSKIHHNNLLNNILAKIQANVAGKDAAVMFDERGFVAELNDVNLFMVHRGKVFTPYAHACLPGITRQNTINTVKDLGISIEERNLSITEFYNADAVFASGTMGELTPVYEIDGRMIATDSPVLHQIQEAFRQKIKDWCEPV